MNIRKQEDELFKQWSKKYTNSTFLIDGCPNPNIYLSEKRKIIFVLKDGNLGKSHEGSTYDQRNDLEKSPHKWWQTIAKWCYFLNNETATWKEAKTNINTQEATIAALSRHCFIQLKKEGGVGSISNIELNEVIKKDKNEIINQLSLYSPNFVIACGNGEQISSLFGCSGINRKETGSGIGYWEINLNNKHCCLVDYCHPSIRAGTKIKGLIAQGLSLAISDIEKNNSNK